MSIKLKGADALIGKLKRNADLSDVKNVVKLNTSEMQRKSQRFAPVDTGTLKRNIKQSTEDSGFTGKVTSTSEYAAYQEYGTRYQSGKPHIRPAYNQQKVQFKKDMNRLMK